MLLTFQGISKLFDAHPDFISSANRRALEARRLNNAR
jgi:hypothetical protein